MSVRWRDVSVWLPEAAEPTLADVELTIGESELVLVAGRTGSGKSTLLRTVNGLVPRFSGGRMAGDVEVHGRSVRGRPPRELADLVGFVGQDPLAGFVTESVEDELAYGMEQQGVAPAAMRRRVEETLDLLGIADLRGRPLASLSGGQQQRVAIGSVLTSHPRVLVLDEPTSALDPTAAEDVLGTVARLVHDLGLTVLVAEHRLERVLPFADRLVLVEDARVRDGSPAELMQSSPVAPPVVELGRLAGWHPLPLTVREARRRSSTLPVPAAPASAPGAPTAAPVLWAEGVKVRYGGVTAVRGVSIAVAPGRVVALMGRNGSGKSSLLWALQGSGRRDAGRVEVAGRDPGRAGRDAARGLVGLVPQTPGDLLYLETVAEECAAAEAEVGATPGAARTLLDSLAPGVPADRHPRDLSEGQRLAVALAVMLVARPRVLLLDEPTRGLDYPAKAWLATTVAGLAAEGIGVLFASHDVEFVAQVADEAVVMADGEVVSAGPCGSVLAESPAFAPQVAKVLGPPWLTVAQVKEALA